MSEEALTKVFAYGETLVRVSGDGESLRFNAKDICTALGLTNTSKALDGLPESEKGITSGYTLGGPQEMLVVTEAGLYRLIFRSDKPEARRFQDWVFKEVLPAIRKTGVYEQTGWLKQAFSEAKTGKVQLALLNAIGIASPGEAAQLRASQPMRALVDVEQFWSDVLALQAGGKIKLESFKVRALPTIPATEQLFLHPDVIHGVLREEKYRATTRADLRAALSLSGDWFPGPHNERFSSSASTVKAWGFTVTEDSSAALVTLFMRVLEQVRQK